MSNLIIMCGLPGSGKSTHAKTIRNSIIISTDDIREEINGNASIQDNADKVFNLAFSRISSYLTNKEYENVIFDATNINYKKRMNLIEKYKKKADKIKCIFIFAAYKELENVSKAGSKVFDILETAIEYSVENMHKLKGTTVIAIDISGSMNDTISDKSTIRCCDLSALLGVLATKICDNAIVYTFNNGLYKEIISSKDGILSTTNRISKANGGTDLYLPLQNMITKNIKADRLIILSDNEINNGWHGGYAQTCQTLADQYRKQINQNLWVHAIDLQGYGTQQFIGKNTNIIAGWSEKVLDFIGLAENDRSKQVEMIENYGN